MAFLLLPMKIFPSWFLERHFCTAVRTAVCPRHCPMLVAAALRWAIGSVFMWPVLFCRPQMLLGCLLRVPQESGACWHVGVLPQLLCVRGSLFLTGQGAVLFNTVSILY